MNKMKPSFFSPNIGTDSSSFENAVIKPPQNSKVLEYALPAAAVLESILTGGKSPGTASLSALGNLSAGQDKYQSLLKQQDTAKTSALERKAKEAELGYKQNAEERAASSEERAKAAEGRTVEDKQKEQDAQTKFGAMYRQLNPQAQDADVEYFSKNRGEYFKQESAKLPPITPAIAATLKDPVLKELAAQSENNPAARKQFWTEYASKYEAQAAAKLKADEAKTTKDFTELEKIKVKMDKVALPHIDVSDAITRARESLTADNPVMDEALKTSLARMSGEKGPLSDQDIARYSGSKAWGEQMKRYVSKGFTGKMTEQDRVNLAQLIDVYESSNNKAVVDKMMKNKKYYESQGKDISDIVDQVIPTSVPRDDMGGLIIRTDKNTGKRYIQVGKNAQDGNSFLEIR